MRDRLLIKLAARVTSAPGRMLVVAALLFVVSLPFAIGVPVQAGHSALFDKTRPHWARLFSFLERFGSPNVLFVLAEGGTADSRRKLMVKLAERLPGPAKGALRCPADSPLRAPNCVRGVFARLEMGALEGYAPLFVPAKQLAMALKVVQTLPVASRERLAGIRDLPTLFDALATELVALGAGGSADAKVDAQATKGAAAFAALLDELGARLGSDHRAERELLGSLVEAATKALGLSAEGQGIDAHGFFVSKDGGLHLAMVRPNDESDDPEIVVPFVRYVERHAKALASEADAACRRRHQAATACPAHRIYFTGMPALIATEQGALSADLVLTSTVAALAVLAIFIFGFRSLGQGLLGIIPLAVSLLVTLVIVRLTVGGLNLATSAFLPTALGLGIDFSIHLLSRYNEARHSGEDARAAAQEAVLGAGPGMITGGLTTAAAFGAMAVNEFRGFVQLGSITALSVVSALIASLLFGPALLADPRLAKLQTPPKARPAREGRGFFAGLLRYKATVLGLALGLTVWMVWRGQQIPWSHNYLDLLPKNDPAAVAMAMLAKRTDFSGEVAALEAPSLEAARSLTARLSRLSSVGRVESLASYLPEEQPQKIALLAGLAPLAQAIRAAQGAAKNAAASRPVSTLTPLRRALERLRDGAEDARFAAKNAGKLDAQKLLHVPLAALDRLIKALGATPRPGLEKRLARTERAFAGLVARFQQIVLAAPTLKALSAEALAEKLPQSLGERLYNKGSYALYIYPSSWVWGEGFLERFVAELRSVDARVTGFPVTHMETHFTIQRGFRSAALLTSAVLLVMLYFDFRSLLLTLLAALPVALGLAWTWGGIGMLGMKYNFANIIGFPLVIGIGVASGVHILHRFRQAGQHRVAEAVRRTGLPILLSGLTTMAGFGSLVLARHRGAASLGALLLIGVSACLLSALIVLPALLAFGRRQDEGSEREEK